MHTAKIYQAFGQGSREIFMNFSEEMIETQTSILIFDIKAVGPGTWWFILVRHITHSVDFE
jgi:hypothetical protein